MPRLLLYAPTAERLAPALAAHGPGLEVLILGDDGAIRLDGAEISPEAAQVEAAWANHEVFFSPAARPFFVALLKSSALRWVQSAAAGFDNAVFGEIARKGAILTTSHGQAVGMADYVLHGVLDHFQRGPERRAAQANRVWWRESFREVAGSTWLIVGFGAIGQGVAQRARAFGAEVIGVKRDRTDPGPAHRLVGLENLAAELPGADVVVLSVPLTPATRHLADAGFFAAMKPGSVFVNVGRGGLVDEAALLAALDRGVPDHAVLDVFAVEPLPTESPFWAHPRVSLNGHASGLTGGQHSRNEVLFLDNLDRFLKGHALRHPADPADVLAGLEHDAPS